MIRCMGCMAEIPDGTDICPYCGYVRGTPAREAYHLAPESILAGRYIAGRVLGYGGFGVTYIGWDAQLERIVAIKEFLPSTFATRMPGHTALTVYDGEATAQFGFGLDRFVQEAQRLAQFNGIPGITEIYDTFSGNNTAYIVMQFLKGQDVKDLLSARGPMPYEQARDIILSVCDTLAPVHARGIIHRDISPDNIYLTDDGEVKLLDFGAARYESSVNSKSLSVILKAGYAPEEQYRSKGDQGPWTDVYALAATFYKMLTGATPDDSMERAIKDELKEPSKLGAQLPQSAENAIMNALNIRKADRTQSVEAFKQALLADGVERVKVKQRRADGGLPTWGKVVLGISAVLILVFGVLLANGNLRLDTPAVLEDDYGSPVQEGYASVPSLAGLSEEEAQEALTEAGLEMEVTENVMNDNTAYGLVMTQDPLGGRQLEAGGKVKVTLSLGSFEDAMAAGRLPNLAEMDVVQAMGFLFNMEPELYSDFYYYHNDEVPAGKVIDFSRIKGESSVTVNISVGPEGELTRYGQVQVPYLERWSSLSYRFAVSSADYQPGNDDFEDYTGHRLMVSANGSDWEQLYEDDQIRYWRGEEDIAEGRPYYTSHGFGEELVAGYPQLAGQDLQLRLDRFRYDYDAREMAELIDSTPFPQTVRVEYKSTGPQVDSVEKMSWSQVQEMIDDGSIHENENIAYRMKDMPYSEREDQTPYIIRGSFEKDTDYVVRVGSNNSSFSDRAYTGDHLIVVLDYWATAELEGPLELVVYESPELQVSEDGSRLTLLTTQPITRAAAE